MVILQVGDVVRVRHARRRDLTFTVSQVTPQVIGAVNDRGGEARYHPASFERVERTRNAPEALAGTQGNVASAKLRESDDLMRASAPPAEIRDGLTVRPFPGESADSTVKRFAKVCDKSGVLREYRRRRHFIPKSQRLRDKSSRARARRAKLQLD